MIPTTKLNSGHNMPVIGMGCCMDGSPTKVKDDPETYEMVKLAIETGYRHFDTAYWYNNEQAVGRAIRESGIPRSEFFVTTKLCNWHHHKVQEGFDESLANLDIGYIDLYLLHWPFCKPSYDSEYLPYGESPTFVETWLQMEKLLGRGKIRSLGVANFSVKNLEILLAEARVTPAVNQVEAHPYLPQKSLTKFCSREGIALTAYAPLGHPHENKPSPLLSDPLIRELSRKYDKSAGTILLSWACQRGWSVTPKSADPQRMKDNLEIITLTKAEFAAISSLHEQPGKLKSLADHGQHAPGMLHSWTLEEMGWDKLD